MRKNDSRLRKLLPYVLEVVAAVAIIAGVWFGTAPQGNAQEPAVVNGSTNTSQGGVVELGTTLSGSGGSAAQETTIALEANTNEDIEALVKQYYQARENADADTMNKIVDSDTQITKEELESEKQYISRYGGITTYTFPYLTGNYYLVYVSYDIYFTGIYTGAPALNRYVVTRDSDGYYYFYDRTISGELRTFITETDNRAEILALREQIEKDLEEACEKDVALYNLMNMLNGSTEASTEGATAIDSSNTTTRAESTEETDSDRTTEEGTTEEGTTSEGSETETTSRETSQEATTRETTEESTTRETTSEGTTAGA